MILEGTGEAPSPVRQSPAEKPEGGCSRAALDYLTGQYRSALADCKRLRAELTLMERKLL